MSRKIVLINGSLRAHGNTDIIFYPGLSAKRDALNNKEYLKNAYNLGQKWAQSK